MSDYLSKSYPGSVDEIAIDEYQQPSVFNFEQAHTTNPLITLKDGWHGFGSLSQIAFIDGGSITDNTSNLLITNLEVVGLDVDTLTATTIVASSADVGSGVIDTITNTTLISSSGDFGSLSISSDEITATANEINRYNDESGLIKTMSMADYTILDDDAYSVFKAVTSSADITLALPTSADNKGRFIHAYKHDDTTGTLTILPEGSETISGDSQALITLPGGHLSALCDGANWKYLTRSGNGQTYGHVQAGNKIWIPSDYRNEFDLSDSSVGDSMELCDLSALVPAGAVSIFGYIQIRTTSSQDKMLLLVRGYRQNTGDGSAPSDFEKIATLRMSAEIGAHGLLYAGSYVEIYAPGGRFEYQRYSSAYPIDNVNFTLWGYYTK